MGGAGWRKQNFAYLCTMYVRKKHNRSGSTSVVVVVKHNGRYKEIKSFGSSYDNSEIERLVIQAKQWIATYGGQQQLDFDDKRRREREETERVVGNMDALLINGTQLLLGRIYEEIGFNAVKDEVLRHLVIARLSQPRSKLATVDYLKSYYDEDVNLDRIYNYMDKLYNRQQELVQRISVEHTRRLLGGRLGIVFYDVTTLYFESAREDELRSPGFSKDGKTAETQVVLGLLVSDGGYPLSYSLYNGKQYEGYTMIPMIDDFKQRYGIGDEFVVVADSGLMNSKNINLLRKARYSYIIGARIKNETQYAKDWILSHRLGDGQFAELAREHGERLIVGYSKKRADKDAYNRKRGIERLRKAYSSGTLTKAQVNRRGYNKFLEISKDVTVEISEQKINEDRRWDGLKGYITNTDLIPEKVVEQYHGLWVVERAFRVSKGTLEMRPMFHFNPRRIEAHVCICFVAYKVYKELERQIMLAKIPLSVDKVIDIAKTIITMRIRMPENGGFFTKTMFLTDRHKSIMPLFDNKITQI